LEKENCPKVNIRFDTMFTLEFIRPTYLASMEMPNEAREENREETREKILRLIFHDPQITTDKLANIIGISQKGVEWQVAQLKKDGLLERIGPTKGGHWKIVEES
jgi:ATP-dependent DNA helicase RecG